MSNGRQNRLPAGLPACLSSRSDGFVKLCELIEVNSRNDKHRLAKDKNVKWFLRDRYLEGIGSERGITDRGTTNCKRDTDACRTGAISSRRK